MRARAVLACYLLLASIYLLYWPHAEFVIDDWFMLQRFAQARAAGPTAEWQLAGVLATSRLWGTFRIHSLSLLTMFGLYRIGGHHPGFYFLLGVALQAAVAFLLYRVLARLEFDNGAAFLAGALFVVMPTARNPLFWFPSCGQYMLAAFWFLIYLHSVAGTVMTGNLRVRTAVFQTVTLGLTVFSTDQSVGLALFAALWVALLWKSRAGLRSAALAWASCALGGAVFVLLVNRVPIGGSVVERFQFSSHRFLEQLRLFGSMYGSLAGADASYYRVRAIGWGAVAAAASGLVVFWTLRRKWEEGRAPASRAVLLGAGMWAMAYGPIWLLRWTELRYFYLQSIGLAVVLAAACHAMLARFRPLAFATAAAGLVAYSAATAYAEIQQCWKPQSQHLESIKQQFRQLKDLQDHDFIVVAAVPLQMGTARHFALFACPYSSTPFAETVTGARSLLVGREIFCEGGKFGMQLDFMRELQPEQLRQTHVLFTDGDLKARVRVLLACEVGANQYQLYPLKDYAGSPPVEARTYTHDELSKLAHDVYVAHRHLLPAR